MDGNLRQRIVEQQKQNRKNEQNNGQPDKAMIDYLDEDEARKWQ
jgi:hypothetical protein